MSAPLVIQEYQSLGLKRGKYKPRASYSAIVVHTTGAGLIRRWRKQGKRFNESSPFETAIRVYTRMMNAGPHYVVGQGGELAQVCPEYLAAWHVGSRNSGRYSGRVWGTQNTTWWRRRWPQFESPHELAGGKLWDGGSCNDNSIGIEVVPPAHDPKGAWSDECWETLLRLILDISDRKGIPVDRFHVISHSDAHPRARSSRGLPWDTPPRQWTPELFEKRLAAFV